jgi:flagellar motility protein MotE (MotC chaperone)
MVPNINPSLASAKKRSTVPLKKVAPARFRLMPLTIGMLSLLLIARVGSVYSESMQLRQLLIASAQASEEPKEEGHGEEGEKKEGGKDKAKEPGGSKMSESEVKALKKLSEQTKYNQIELDLLQNLSKRRDELDVREKELDLKQKALDASEQRISSRIFEMKKLQEEVEKIVNSYKQQQQKDVQSLVKIYENMKPSDAATIFNQLQMPILLSVIGSMSERKVAPVLASMDPKRAKEVTEELAELRKAKALPTEAAAPVAP